MKLIYPVVDHNIGQKFGEDRTGDPVYGEFYKLFDNRHCGVDFHIPVGTQVRAAWPGKVVRREFHEGMGLVIGIRWKDFVMLYAHLSEFGVELGDKVKQGELLGLSGQTGAASPLPHLHFEMRDITKPTLKEMVFEPPFGKDLAKAKFKYLVG